MGLSPNLGARMVERLRARGSEPALQTPEQTYSGTQCAEWIESCAAGLERLGVGPGDLVAVALPNRPEFPVANAAAWRIGAAYSPVSPLLGSREASQVFELAKPRALIVDAEARDRFGVSVEGIEHVIEVEGEGWEELLAGGRPGPAPPQGIASVAFTSGSTGDPKGAEIAAEQIQLSQEIVATTFGLGPEDTILQVLPYFHSNASLTGVALAWWLGGKAAMLPRFEPAALSALVAEAGVHFGACVPTIMHDMVAGDADPRAWRSFRHLVFGAMRLPEGVREEFERRFEVRTVNTYGMTEAPNMVTAGFSSEAGTGVVGKALPHVEIVALGEDGEPLGPGEAGELAIGAATTGPYAGRYRPLGAYRSGSGTLPGSVGGRFRTGDVGAVAADGTVSLLDRVKDMISCAGFKVYPAEIERLLSEDERVGEVYVVGRPDRRRGEVPVAFVVPTPGERVDPEQLRERVRTELAAYKQLAEVRVCAREELPRTGLGKVRKVELRDLLAET